MLCCAMLQPGDVPTAARRAAALGEHRGERRVHRLHGRRCARGRSGGRGHRRKHAGCAGLRDNGGSLGADRARRRGLGLVWQRRSRWNVSAGARRPWALGRPRLSWAVLALCLACACCRRCSLSWEDAELRPDSVGGCPGASRRDERRTVPSTGTVTVAAHGPMQTDVVILRRADHRFSKRSGAPRMGKFAHAPQPQLASTIVDM